jgi:hypothetical protein
MMRLILRAGTLLVIILWLVPAGFANSPAKSNSKKEPTKTDEIADASSSNPKTADAALSADTSPATDESPAQKATGSGQAGAGEQNRRIDIIWVPEGATY